jgi:hypothetical protein
MRQLLRKKAGEAQAPTSAQEATPSLASSSVPVADNIQRGYPDSSAHQPSPTDDRTARAEAFREALGSSSGPRGEALKSSMKKLLTAKASDSVVAATTKAAPVSEAAAQSASLDLEGEEVEDPWPEMPMSRTVLGVEDGKQRAKEQNRRLDFGGACRMWAKVHWIACRTKPPLAATALAEIEAQWTEAKKNVPTTPSRPSVADEEMATFRIGDVIMVKPTVDEPKHGWCSVSPGDRGKVIQVTGVDLVVDFGAIGKDKVWKAYAPEMQEAPAAEPLKEVQPSAAHSQPSRAIAKSSHSTSQEACKDKDDNFDPGTWNQTFFDRMEQDYDDLCASDGWDDIQRRQKELERPPRSIAAQDGIPADSDYFRVKLPPGSDRELRYQPGDRPTVHATESKAPQSQARRLDELRRVEAATQSAIDKEKARRAAETSRATAPEIDEDDKDHRPPIRTKSDVVYLDSLSDDSLDSDKEPEIPKDVDATFTALAQFEQLAREKEERLAKWRERWG